MRRAALLLTALLCVSGCITIDAYPAYDDEEMASGDEAPRLEDHAEELEGIDGVVVEEEADGLALQIDEPSVEPLNAIAEVLLRYETAVTIEASGDVPFDTRDTLIEAGLPPELINAKRIDEVQGVRLRIRHQTEQTETVAPAEEPQPEPTTEPTAEAGSELPPEPSPEPLPPPQPQS